ncbi:hypothetical protein Ciccas_009625 [Cichlidogyrus casuarinus]|uniref:YAP binding domain-containing protein n=1 Tax=Cichlidogyrus casuarinus TaxID=1844966 RepID=A0ABD2PXH1_9PLAT
MLSPDGQLINQISFQKSQQAPTTAAVAAVSLLSNSHQYTSPIFTQNGLNLINADSCAPVALMNQSAFAAAAAAATTSPPNGCRLLQNFGWPAQITAMSSGQPFQQQHQQPDEEDDKAPIAMTTSSADSSSSMQTTSPAMNDVESKVISDWNVKDFSVDRGAASYKFRLLYLVAFAEIFELKLKLENELPSSPGDSVISKYFLPPNHHVHKFVELCSPEEPNLERINVSKIQDKLPPEEISIILKSPAADSFFLIKFWADVNTQLDESMGLFTTSM